MQHESAATASPMLDPPQPVIETYLHGPTSTGTRTTAPVVVEAGPVSVADKQDSPEGQLKTLAGV